MPSFFTNTLPPTPPLTITDYYGAHSENVYRTNYPLSIRPSGFNGPIPAYDQGRHEEQNFPKQYSQYPASHMQRPAFHLPEIGRHMPPAYSASTHSSSDGYGTSSAPVLPPIQALDRSLDDYQQQVRSNRAATVSQPKEEKAVGGVAIKLDYEMDHMVDFVSEMAQGMYDIYTSRICLADIDMTRSIVDSTSPMPPDFRKFVFQVLSSTRLPSSTVILGLHYLAERMTLLSNSGRYNYGRGKGVYHMLTTALLLGSKFLDDNTFQNRSWSEVSNIPVGELNILELEWLTAIKWNMHIDFEDSEGFALWEQRWKRYQSEKTEASLAESLKQTHLGSNFQRQRSLNQHFSATSRDPYTELSVGNGLTERYDQWPPMRSYTDYSPPSAPQTGPTTPSSYGNLNGHGYGHLPRIYPLTKLPPALHVVPSNAPGYQTPYTQQYSQYGHGSHCGCAYCLSHHERFFMAPGYGPQPVVG